jgi:hypothetical protein
MVARSLTTGNAMARQFLDRRKRRTRQHVIADQSVHHVEGFILAEGHTGQRLERDYGYDVLMFTYDEQGYVEPGFLYLQIKASETFKSNGLEYMFDLDIRDYNLWTLEKMPVILILFDVSRRRASWIPIQRYFRDDPVRRPKPGVKTVRVYVPMQQTVNRRAIARMRELKQELFA